MQLYPLKFKPWFLKKIWGGRKIQTVLGKELPARKMIGESWEIYDFAPGVPPATDRWLSSVVANGPLAGKTLHELVLEFGGDLYGDVSLVGPHGQFPILIKFLDAKEDLSVQVHPDVKYVSKNAGAHLKNEAWYIVQADPGSQLLKGLAPGVTREAFAGAIAAGTVESLINAVNVKPGECYYLPSGTVHALKAGILAAEIQTPSDTTYRVYDFNRTDAATGKPRPLHIEQAMQCIDFSGKPEAEQIRSQMTSDSKSIIRMAVCDYFKIDKVRYSQGVQKHLTPGEPVIWMMLEGEARVSVDGAAGPTRVGRGETVLFPSVMKNPILSTTQECEWLEITFPKSKRGTGLR